MEDLPEITVTSQELTAKVAAVLPGLGAYSASSDSESTSSDSEPDTRLFGTNKVTDCSHTH